MRPSGLRARVFPILPGWVSAFVSGGRFRGITMSQTNGLEVTLKSERPQPTEKEIKEIKRLDGIVRKSLNEIKGQDTAFANLGDALRCFRDQKLWRFTHDSFRDYCRDIWHITDRWARKLMVAADVLAGLAESAEGNRGSA